MKTVGWILYFVLSIQTTLQKSVIPVELQTNVPKQTESKSKQRISAVKTQGGGTLLQAQQDLFQS